MEFCDLLIFYTNKVAIECRSYIFFNKIENEEVLEVKLATFHFMAILPMQKIFRLHNIGRYFLILKYQKLREKSRYMPENCEFRVNRYANSNFTYIDLISEMTS